MNHIIKLLKISWKNIGQNGVHNMIVMIFVICSVFFMNISLSSFRHCIYQNTLVQSAGLYDLYMYAGIPSKQTYYDNSSEDMFLAADYYVRHALDKTKGEGYISGYFPIYETNTVIDGNQTAETKFFFANYDLLKDLSFPVAKGEWFDTYSFEASKDTPIPIVIGYNLKSIYHVGEIVTINGFDDSYIVAGILKPNTLFIHSGAGGSGIDLNSVTQIADDMIIVAKEAEGYQGSFMIKLSDNSRDVSEKAVLKEIADVVDTFSFQYLADEAYQSNLFEIQMQITLSILALLICIVGMECGNLLSFVRGKRRLAVYFICGMNKKTSILVNLFEGALKLYCPAIVGFHLFFLYCKKESFDGLYVDFMNTFFTVLVITLIFAGTLIRTLHIAEKNDELMILQA